MKLDLNPQPPTYYSAGVLKPLSIIEHEQFDDRPDWVVALRNVGEILSFLRQALQSTVYTVLIQVGAG